MKQLITALVLSLSITAASATNPTMTIKKPARILYEEGKEELVIVPNLKTGVAVISFKAEKASKGVIFVFNEAGNVVLKQPVKIIDGKNKLSLNNFTSLPEGNYTVCLNTSHKIYSAPFLLWK